MSSGEVLPCQGHGPRATYVDRWLLGELYRRVAPAPCRFVLWDGSWTGTSDAPGVTVTILDRAALLGLAVNADLYFGEAYMRGALRIAGADLADALTVIYEGLRDGQSSPARASVLRWWRRLQVGPSLRAARANVHHHYDLGNDFYRRWLDDELVYTCAYYETPDVSLETAQRAKMELVCRKLRLQPGEGVVEAGCGWGALARYMARHYGVRVRAFNVSAEQIAYAREVTRRDGLASRVEFVEADYRDIDEPCDAFVSIGMLEHVGQGHYDALGALMSRVLDRGRGRGLLHFIGRSSATPLNPWIRRRIFPGAYPPTLSEVCGRVLEPHGFTVTDIENLRPHYAQTLAAWRRRFERAAPDVGRMFDDTFVRAWRLYLAGSEASFRAGSVELFQVAFGRVGLSVPWTRHVLCAPMAAAPDTSAAGGDEAPCASEPRGTS